MKTPSALLLEGGHLVAHMCTAATAAVSPTQYSPIAADSSGERSVPASIGQGALTSEAMPVAVRGEGAGVERKSYARRPRGREVRGLAQRVPRRVGAWSGVGSDEVEQQPGLGRGHILWMIDPISVSSNARRVSVRTLPKPATASVAAIAVCSSGVSNVTTMSYCPCVQ